MSSFTKTAKPASTFSKSAKQPSVLTRSRILTDILDQVLVGENKDEVLIWRAFGNTWGPGTKPASTFTKVIKP